MYQKTLVDLRSAQQGIQTMLNKAMEEPNRPVAMAVVDADGKLVSYARMDGCRLIPQQLSVKKAYTAAVMGSDTQAVAERMQQMGRSITALGDPGMTDVQGGVVIQGSDGTVLGGIGVSGLRADEDEALAKLGLGAMQLP